MQNVFFRSSLTYEWTQVTPTSALRSTTPRHAAAPSSLMGIARPLGKRRSIGYRAMLGSFELVGIDRIRRLQWAMARNTGTSGSLPRLARAIPIYSRRYYPGM